MIAMRLASKTSPLKPLLLLQKSDAMRPMGQLGNTPGKADQASNIHAVLELY
jgi:hypothetical protein